MNAAAPAKTGFLDETKALACVHCGLCLGSCPTYLETGNENESPRGRIYIMRALQDGRLSMTDSTVRHIDLCLGCRACETACPSGVQYGALLESTREYIEKRHERSLFQRLLRRFAIEQIIPFPARMRWALGPARLVRKLGLHQFLPKFARDAVGLLPESASSVRVPEFSPAAGGERRGRVGFVSGCVMSIMFGDTNVATVRLLNKLGFDVVNPPKQICCGALDAHSGNLNRAREFAKRNIAVFEELNIDAIIINAAGCGSTLKEYGHLLHDDPEWAGRARSFSDKVMDLTEWIAPLIQKSKPNGEGDSDSITYHDACHLAHPQRITVQPRDLIRAVCGDRLHELPESDVCCGSAGSYNLTEPEMAERLQRRKVENILKTGAKTVVTTNPGCILQIRAGLRKVGALDVRVLHIADFLQESAARVNAKES